MSQLHIYTDGACSHNKSWVGGWGFVVHDGEKELFRASGAAADTTNNRMELTAVIEALKYLKENESFFSAIYTDSSYIVNAFEQRWIDGWLRRGWTNAKKQPVANKDLWLELIKLKEINTDIIKVKGHSTDKYNNIADKLATEAREEYEKNLNNTRNN